MHYFTHRLQLVLNVSVKDVNIIFFKNSMLNSIVNFIYASSKHQSKLKLTRKSEVEELLSTGNLETDRRANQTSTLR